MAELDAEELRELRKLHLQLGRRVDSLFSGDYRAAVRGQGMEFEEVRAYVPGDDVRHIDWNVTARSGEPHVKVFREERQLTVMLVLDASASTKTGGVGSRQRRLQMARVAGGLAWAALQNQDRVGLLTFTDRVETYIPPRRTRGHVWGLIKAAYAAEAEGQGTRLHVALDYLGRVQRRRAVVVVISDFVDDGPWSRGLTMLARRHEVHAVWVHDPLDHGALDGLGLMEVVDAESGEVCLVDGSAYGEPSSTDERRQVLTRAGVRAAFLGPNDDPHRVLRRHFAQVRGGR